MGKKTSRNNDNNFAKILDNDLINCILSHRYTIWKEIVRMDSQ